MGQPTIAAPGDLRIPDKMDEVMASLTNEGARAFIDEMTKALATAEATNDLASVQYVVNAWYVSRRFLTHPEIDKALETSLDLAGSNLYHSADELGARLGVA